MQQVKSSALGLRERKKQATQLAIIKTAMDLFSSQGFQETSMEQIAEQSDVAKATLYKYFPVKEAIIAAHWQEELKNSQHEFLQIIDEHPDTRSRLEAGYAFIITRIMQSRELYEIYISYRLQHISSPEINKTLRSGMAENVAVIIAAGQKNGEIRTDIPLEILVSNLELLSVLQAMVWLRYPDQFSVDATSKMFTALFLDGAVNHAAQ